MKLMLDSLEKSKAWSNPKLADEIEKSIHAKIAGGAAAPKKAVREEAGAAN